MLHDPRQAGDKAEQPQPLAAPAITLPKGGGAIRGIGEKFAANPVTGTGSMSVPIATSPGRSGFGPELSLSYDSGAGNGPFGFGWSLGLPQITRKTDKGLPQYNDAAESDVFLLSGAEDLVPWLDANGERYEDTTTAPGYTIQRYRPRIEGLFARIERWTRDDGDVHWRSISRDNVLSVYGRDGNSRIFDPSDPDPENPQRIFSWLICETRDDRGNALAYEYKPEDGADVDLGQAHERNRGERADPGRTANRYLKRIRYGNRLSLLDAEGRRPRWLTAAQMQDAGWMFEVVFDYGEHEPDKPKPHDAGRWTYREDDHGKLIVGLDAETATGHWGCRNDPFSSYRAGFEVRTYRLCRRVLMFHHFPDQEGVRDDCLVRSTDFTYSAAPDPTGAHNPVYTFLNAVTQSGYQREGDAYRKRSLPPVEFEYSQPVVLDAVEDVDAASLENLPIGLDGAVYQWTDLHGEGIPGILTEQAGAWFYKRNLSPINESRENGTVRTEAKFAPVERVARKPNLALAGGAQFMDLAGDGQPDLVVLDDPMSGLYEHDGDEGWEPFRPFTSRLNRDTRDPNLRFVDLDGDGHADVLITESDALVWHPSLAEAGFGPARRLAQALDEEKGPRLVFADGTQSIYLADMSGDGLADLARIRNGEVCYWPNLGYGRFGAKVTMDLPIDTDQPPCFDHPDQFDQRRIRLADIDGTGTTDIIYLHRRGVRLYFNQCGNAWSAPRVLRVFPGVDDLAAIMPVDLLGNGTACLVWSSPLPGNARRPMCYVNLMGKQDVQEPEPHARERRSPQKPHLLVAVRNNLGAETRIHYAPSTKFYLQDKYAGRPWITRLPFPVHVVERVETIDSISRNRFVTRYAYHHGYFDGEEREFRGFGMVEQWDTEEFAALTTEGTEPWATNLDPASHVPLVLTRTWFHTGAYLDRDHISRQFEDEYYREPGLSREDAGKLLLPDTTLPKDLPPEEEREACRALKGMMLRQEVYALDGTGTDKYPHGHPYTVVEQDFTIRHVQLRADNRHGVFFTHPCEVITYHYERELVPVLNGEIVDEVTAANDARTQRLPDPRVQHALTLEVDPFGNVLKEAVIGYGRRYDAPDAALLPEDRERQRLIHITCTENAFTNAIVEEADDYRTPLLAESRTYELRKPEQEKSGNGLTVRFPLDELRGHVEQAGDGQHDVEYEDLHFARSKEVVASSREEAQQYFRRLIEHTRTLYRPDDLGVARNDPLALLPLGEVEVLALPGESYTLAFTPGLLAQVYQRNNQPLLPNPGDILGGTGGDQGGYVDLDGDGHWWIPSGRSFHHPHDVTAAVELAEARAHFFLPRRYRDPFGQSAVVNFDSHDLLMVETRDALGNRVTVEANDYRVLQPRLVSDPNRNQTEVAFDTLGMVVGTAVMSKPTDNPRQGDQLGGLFAPDPPQVLLDAFIGQPREAGATPHASVATQAAHDLLANATTRIVYDLNRFMRLGEPPFAATIARETHVSDLSQAQEAKSKLQISFSYSDGFGREIQKKIQAEPGPLDVHDPQSPHVNPRWVGSGWTIFNNKGKPVRQYEPFFDDTHAFKFAAIHGVSPVLFYDPAERVVATLHPNHSWEKVVFDPWQQTTFDVNDTVLLPVRAGDPLRDADVADYFGRLPDTDYLPTWHELRTQPAHAAAFASRYPAAEDRQNETKAAERAAAHADTPTTDHFDALGRPFLTVARNRVVCEGHRLHNKPDEDFRTRVELDIEGNQRTVFDERKLPDADHLPLGPLEQRVVMQYAYDMLGNRIHQSSMEAGARWILSDVTGKPIRTWDSRGHNFTTKYDALRRPIEQYVRGTFSDPDPLKLNSDPRTLNPPNQAGLLVDRIEYGEPPLDATPAQEQEAQRLNLRTRTLRHSDSAGIATNARLDAAGKPLEAYDFKGNLLRSTRQLVSDYKVIPDWSQNQALDAETFEGNTRYDGLNRPIQSVAPHSSLGRGKFNIIQPVFNEANLLERVDVWLERPAEPAGMLNPANEAPSPVGVTNIDYDAKGQRTLINYKNGASTFYRYDPLTFRLSQLLTKRRVADFPGDDPQPADPAWPGKQVQNLHYTYDPAGNITHIQDDAQQTIFFRNKRVEPSNDYTYDALYRLIQATGREHLGQIGGAPIPHSYNDAGRVGLVSADAAGRFAPNDGTAMGTYTERYVYDAVGNFLQMQHRGTDPAHAGWTRAYEYLEDSLIEDGNRGLPLKASNRLTRTTLNPNGADPPQVEPYLHDAHGNVVRMPHLGGGLLDPNMCWDYKDQLRQTELGGGGAAFYVYDASGQRVRKVWEKAPGLTEERIYLGGFEIFRRHGGPIGTNTVTLERETLHVMDDKQRIALVEMRTLGDEQDVAQRLIRYQFGNHLGSSTLELDEKAQIISYEEYAPYGSSTYQAVRSQTETAKRYRYTGKERDEESGLYYHRVRYYAAWLGRWSSCDPAGLVDGTDLFAFVRNNSICLVDPNGKQGTATTPIVQIHLTPEQEAIFRENEKVFKAIERDLETRANAGEFSKSSQNPPAARKGSTDPSTKTEWVMPTTKHSPIPMVTEYDTGNGPANYVLNKVVLPWRNLLAGIENTPFEIAGAIDDAMQSSPFRMEWQAFQDMAPMSRAMGLTLEMPGLLEYGSAAMSRALRAPAFPFVGAGGMGSGFYSPTVRSGFQVSHQPTFYSQGAKNSEQIESALTGKGVYQLVGDHPPDELGQTVVRVGEGDLLDRFAKHAHGPDQRVWRGFQVISNDEGLSQRLTLEADIGLQHDLMLSGEASSLYKLPGNQSLGAFAGAPYRTPQFTLLNPSLYPSARLR